MLHCQAFSVTLLKYATQKMCDESFLFLFLYFVSSYKKNETKWQDKDSRERKKVACGVFLCNIDPLKDDRSSHLSAFSSFSQQEKHRIRYNDCLLRY